MSDRQPMQGSPGEDPASITQSLLLRASHSEPDAWKKIDYLYRPLILTWVRRAGVTAADVEDVGQEVMRTVAVKLPSFRRDRPGDTFRGWLWTITHSKLGDFWRRSRTRVIAAGGTTAQAHLQQVPAESDESISHCSPNDLNGLFRRGLDLVRAEFEDRTWRAFRAVVIEERAVADVAAELKMSKASVYVAKSRVLKRLREELGDVLGDEPSQPPSPK